MAKFPRAARRKATNAYHHGHLRQALVDQAVATIRDEGLDALTVRGVGAQLRVSRTALYRHFADKQSLLAAVAAEGFRSFRQALAEAWHAGGPTPAGFRAMGGAYVSFALANRSHYTVMFGGAVSGCPEDLQAEADGAFAVLADALGALQAAGLVRQADLREQAVYVWAGVHGTALLAMAGHLTFPGVPMDRVIQATIGRIWDAIAMPLTPRDAVRSAPTEDEMVAAALEAPVTLLPHLPELLADLEELGSDTRVIVNTLADLHVPAHAQVVDVGCGKGANAIAMAAALGCRVVGVDLFQPFVDYCRTAAAHAGVAHLCGFLHGNAVTLAGQLPPADVVVCAALGDVLGSPRETMGVLRRYVRSGGLVVLADVFLRDGGSAARRHFESYVSHDETVKGLTAWGDTVVQAVTGAGPTLADDDEDDDEDLEAAAAIGRRAQHLAERHPEMAAELVAFAESQAAATDHIRENLVDAVWVLRKA